MPKRNTEYSRAVAYSEREANYFVAPQSSIAKPSYRSELERRISELQLAWRDMSDEEKAAMKAETFRKAHGFIRPRPPNRPRP